MRKKISESEWEIMNAIWKLKKANLSQILEILKGKGWGNSTIQTYLKRLEQKGYLKTERIGHAYLYSATIDERECKIEESRNFINRLFDGSIGNMILQFTKEESIPEKEKKDIKEMIERWEKDGYI